jgi:hypothetical protein
MYPLEMVLAESAGTLNVEQRRALQTVHSALQRLTRASENTVVPGASQKK